jgi:hypothetical protein
VSGTDARVIDLFNTLFNGISRGGMDGGCLDLSYGTGTGRNVSIVECIFDSCGVTGTAGEGGGGIVTSMGLGVGWTIRNSTLRSCTAPDENEGRGGGIFLSLTQSIADFRIVTPCFTNNDAHVGKDVFVISPNLTATVTLSRFPFFDPEQSFDEELMQGWEGVVPYVEGGAIASLGFHLMQITDTVIVSFNGTAAIDSNSCLHQHHVGQFGSPSTQDLPTNQSK